MCFILHVCITTHIIDGALSSAQQAMPMSLATHPVSFILVSITTCVHREKYVSSIPYSRKYCRSLNLVVLPQTMFLTPLVDLNLAVWYSIAICTCIHAEEKLVDFNLAVERHTAKPPNLIPRQILRLYGMHYHHDTLLFTLNPVRDSTLAS